ncbi:MAG: NifB/NifX family molybdenum-iron cluster-binding protein [Phycisphaerales bacterium]|nr:MAG: NifB/NifX family molybdenum-iron cluster-binding protein [Phycisphaerales bacterium]
MRVAVTSMGDTLEQPVGPGAGKCHSWLVVDPVTMEYEAIRNPFATVSGPGAGKFLVAQLKEYGVGVVLVGGFGCNDLKLLSHAGIRVLLGMTGSVRETVEKFKRSAAAFHGL